MNFLAICGSLREGSSNHNLLRAFHKQCPRETVWNLFAIKDLPYFDPQLQFSSASFISCAFSGIGGEG